eukprot:gb/GFBE01054580.1/.p1 GENE.gb/GFBE01054580.1/~~gb/GFBE01054580.1/.p1  ORF type:complete len:340 (+),score=89.27 gb/GFBE01054580.1/:1-1020(+)
MSSVEEQRAKQWQAASEEDLQRDISLLGHLLMKISGHLDNIRTQSNRAEEHRLRQTEVQLLMEQAIRQQSEQDAMHGQQAGRYREGQNLVLEFQDWLNNSYSFMEKTLLQRQQDLARELPQERRRFNSLMIDFVGDLERRRRELKEAMKQTSKKQKMKARDAATAERTPGRSQKARSAKKKAEDLGRDLTAMQEKFDHLSWELEQLKSVPELKDAPAILQDTGSSAWVGNFFWNASWGAPWNVPPALADAPARPAQAEGGFGSGLKRKCYEVVDQVRRRLRGKQSVEAVCSQPTLTHQGGQDKWWYQDNSSQTAGAPQAHWQQTATAPAEWRPRPALQF